MNILKETSEREMLKNWAIAEATSVRRLPYLQEVIPADILDKLSRRDFPALKESDFDTLIKMILVSREELLKGLLQLDLKWFNASITIKELDEARMMNWPSFVELAGSRKLADLVVAFEQGKFPANHHEFRKNLERIRQGLNFGEMYGVPIFVGKNQQAFFYLVEGFTRCSAILMNLRKGIVQQAEFPIIIGFSENIENWYLNDDKNSTKLY